MSQSEVKKVGRFAVEVEVANNDDLVLARRRHLEPSQVRRATIRGVVDSGAARLVLPRAVVKQLGLQTKRKVKVRYADGRRGFRQEVGGVSLKLLGREDVFSAIVEAKRDSALIGAIVLEDLDLLVDCTHQRLYPRDPKFIVSEIE
ncbi:MAG TPA: retroviral-like aspartic protease family protein [Gemmataceae bacterium]|jgi:clan AA aspartic protease|nr:retroviral-like aspartic protease family protein [Gemmataceae bacterium]